MIDTDAAPGDYAPYFERAPTYVGRSLQASACGGTPRCYRDRKAHALKIATTNAIRAKLGWPLMEAGE